MRENIGGRSHTERVMANLLSSRSGTREILDAPWRIIRDDRHQVMLQARQDGVRLATALVLLPIYLAQSLQQCPTDSIAAFLQ